MKLYTFPSRLRSNPFSDRMSFLNFKFSFPLNWAQIVNTRAAPPEQNFLQNQTFTLVLYHYLHNFKKMLRSSILNQKAIVKLSDYSWLQNGNTLLLWWNAKTARKSYLKSCIIPLSECSFSTSTSGLFYLLNNEDIIISKK